MLQVVDSRSDKPRQDVDAPEACLAKLAPERAAGVPANRGSSSRTTSRMRRPARTTRARRRRSSDPPTTAAADTQPSPATAPSSRNATTSPRLSAIPVLAPAANPSLRLRLTERAPHSAATAPAAALASRCRRREHRELDQGPSRGSASGGRCPAGDDDDRDCQEVTFSVERSITLSMKPYSRASSAVNHRSRSESASIRSTGCPVWKAIRSAIIRFR